MTLVDTAKALDAQIAAAGGLARFWIAEQQVRRDRGETYYTHLTDAGTGEVVAAWDESER